MRKSRRGKKRQKKKKKSEGGQIEITSSQKNLVVKTLREKKQSREEKKDSGKAKERGKMEKERALQNINSFWVKRKRNREDI